jgi:type II secretory pathway component GspD/PulD (secretin)
MTWYIKILHRAIGSVLLFCGTAFAATSIQLEKIEFQDAPLIEVVKILTDLSGNNIIATPTAGSVNVNIFLKDVSIHEAIESICRVNDLWYRKDTNGTYRLMTNEEYSKDLVIHKSEETKIYAVYGPNLGFIAEAIENLYGERVELTYSGGQSNLSNSSGSDNSNSNNSRNNSSSNNSSSGSGASSSDKVTERLSVDQLAGLRLEGSGMNVVSGQALDNLTAKRQPIYVSVVSEHNLVLVRTGDQVALNSITKLVKSLDRPVPQVLLEMKVMDVLLGDDYQSLFDVGINGVGLSNQLTSGATGDASLGGGSSLGGGLLFSFISDHLTANLEYLDEKKRISVLSTPMILAANNRPAKLFVGEEVVTVNGYTSESGSSSNTGNNVTVNNDNITPVTTVEEVGNSIEITPYINKDGTVTIQFKQQTSSVKNNADTIAVVSGGTLFNLPLDTISTAEIEGTVIAKDGLTFAIGGLVRETVSDRNTNVPWLSALSQLGSLFTSTSNLNERRELILLITPHIMHDVNQNADNQLLPRKPKSDLALYSIVQCLEACK